MKVKKSPEQWPLTKVKLRIEEIYKELRELTVALLDLNIKQYDNAVEKDVAYLALLELANKHIDLEEELVKLERVVKERTKIKENEPL